MDLERTEQEIQRRADRDAMAEFGVEPYAFSWDVRDYSTDIVRQFEIRDAGSISAAPASSAANRETQDAGRGTQDAIRVSVAGRILTKRVMGKAAFFTVQDSRGTIQVYVRRDDLPEGFYNNVFKRRIAIGDIVGIEGFVFRTQTGEITIHTERLEVLTKSVRPIPNVKEKDGQVFDEVTDKEFRYRQRYVDLIVNPEVRDVFRARAKMISSTRQFLDERGYLEVETPVLQPIYGGAAARPFTTHHNALNFKLFLRIADELYLKRLIVGGFDGVYEISKDFRNEGIDRFHNPEFTMLELYVAYKDYEWMMELVEEMVEHIAIMLHGSPEVQVGDHLISFKRPWKRETLFGAIEARIGIDLFGKSRDELAAVAKSLNIEIENTMGSGKIIDEIFGEKVESTLIQPTFIVDYPIELSPLAKKHRTQPGLVERFEAICNGAELCNAFSELNDPDDQRERFEDQARLRDQGDDEAMQIDDDYIRALEYGMPPTAGLGIGMDRLAMLMTGQSSIRDVIFFPQMRPESKTEGSAEESAEDGN